MSVIREKIKVVAVIGARLNSSRLPGKQLLDLAGKPLIERLFDRLDHVSEIDEIVLATTSDAYNKPLVDWAHKRQRSVFAFSGDVNDLMGRVNAVVEQENADIIVYVCGDSPLIEPITLSRMLSGMRTGLLRDETLDTVDIEAPPAGRKNIHEGFSIFSLGFWQDVYALSVKPEEREHVGAACGKLKRHLNVAILEKEPLIFSEVDHRISVDTPSDYQFMKSVYDIWYQKNPQDSIVSLPWVIQQISENKALSSLNDRVQQKQVGEITASYLLVTETGPGIGLGHLRRVAVIARALQDMAKAKVHVVVVGEHVDLDWMRYIPQHWVRDRKQLFTYLEQALDPFDALIVDFKEDDEVRRQIQPVLKKNKAERRITIAIDGLIEMHPVLDLIWVPSFYVSDAIIAQVPERKLLFGWDRYLLAQNSQRYHWSASVQNKVLVTLGGSDLDGLGDRLPQWLEAYLPQGSEVNWVQGPYAPAPNLEHVKTLRWTTHRTPDDQMAIYKRCDVALVAYGVSLFELLSFGMPLVVVPTQAGPAEPEWAAFQNEDVCVSAQDSEHAAQQLAHILEDGPLRLELHQKSIAILDGRGADRFVETVAKIMLATSASS